MFSFQKSITEVQKDALTREFNNLNLTKYVGECVSCNYTLLIEVCNEVLVRKYFSWSNPISYSDRQSCYNIFAIVNKQPMSCYRDKQTSRLDSAMTLSVHSLISTYFIMGSILSQEGRVVYLKLGDREVNINRGLLKNY